MKSVALISNAKMRVEQRPVPQPQIDECLVRIHSAGICSSDIMRGFDHGAYHYPLVMGHEAAGKIAAVGESITNFVVADRVAIFPLLPCFSCEACSRQSYAQCKTYDYYGSRRDGAFSEYLCVKEWNLMAVPGNVTLLDAALIEPTAVVIHAVLKLLGDAIEGDLLVIGGGFLGLLAVEILHFLAPQVRITVVDRNKSKLKLAERLGAIVFHTPDDNSANNFIKKNDSAYSLVLEAGGTPNSFRNSLRLIARGGRVVWMGNISDDLIIPRYEVSQLLRKEISIFGSWNSDYRASEKDDWTLALQLMEAGLHPSRLADRIVTLDELPEAISDLHKYKTARTGQPTLKIIAQLVEEKK